MSNRLNGPKFRRLNVYGSTIYKDTTGKFELVQCMNSDNTQRKWYIKMSDSQRMPRWQKDGFHTIEAAQEYLASHDWENASEVELIPNTFNEELDFILNMYGFSRKEEDEVEVGRYSRETEDGIVYIKDLGDETQVEVYTLDESDVFDNFDELTKHLDSLFDSGENSILSSQAIDSTSPLNMTVNAAISTRDLAKNLVRVKSSNLWAYTINIRDRKSKVGDVLVQFKGPKGGPGDIYLYMDVPISLWRKWLSAPSKGHFLWKYIRNDFLYRKLTGDRKGKLHNAVNN